MNTKHVFSTRAFTGVRGKEGNFGDKFIQRTKSLLHGWIDANKLHKQRSLHDVSITGGYVNRVCKKPTSPGRWEMIGSERYGTVPVPRYPGTYYYIQYYYVASTARGVCVISSWYARSGIIVTSVSTSTRPSGVSPLVLVLRTFTDVLYHYIKKLQLHSACPR